MQPIVDGASVLMNAVCQPAILALGFTSMLLISQKNRWGFPLALASQPFWFWTTAQNGQWGIFVSSLIYTAMFVNGIRTHFYGAPHDVSRKEEK